VSNVDGTRAHLIETYRKKAKHYDITTLRPATPSEPTASGPYKHSGFPRVRAWWTSPAAPV
jgi:hypothetical protein